MEFTPEQMTQFVAELVEHLGPMMAGIIVVGVIVAVVLNALLKFPVAWGFKKLNGRVGGLTPEELGSAIAESMDIPGYPACFYDPKHFERVKTIEANVKRNNTMLEAMEDGALAGKFGCLWKDTEVTLTSNRIKRLAGESSEG